MQEDSHCKQLERACKQIERNVDRATQIANDRLNRRSATPAAAGDSASEDHVEIKIPGKSIKIPGFEVHPSSLRVTKIKKNVSYLSTIMVSDKLIEYDTKIHDYLDRELPRQLPKKVPPNTLKRDKPGKHDDGWSLRVNKSFQKHVPGIPGYREIKIVKAGCPQKPDLCWLFKDLKVTGLYFRCAEHPQIVPRPGTHRYKPRAQSHRYKPRAQSSPWFKPSIHLRPNPSIWR